MALREEILDTCFEIHPQGITFASGKRANNKLELERIFKQPELKSKVVTALAQLAMKFKPGFVVGVPNGATPWAEAVREELDIDYIVYLDAQEDLRGRKVMRFRNEFLDRHQLVRHLQDGVMIEDALNEHTSVRQALALPDLGKRKKIEAVVAIWDRGLPSLRPPLWIPHEALITEHIPNILPEASDLYQRYCS
jgi:orotate phosphoribosyltransferase